MASQAYLDSYRSYKAGTEKLITWLVDTAKHCHVDTSFIGASNTSHKGKSAKQRTKYFVPLKSLTTLANSIAAANPPVTLPASLVIVTKGVLALRQKCGSLFSKLAKSDARVAFANKGHRHFESVLEEVLAVLSPAEESAPEPKASESTRAELSNMFSALSVEEPSATASAPAGKAHEPSPQYTIEPESFDEVFAILALFDDIQEIRQYLVLVWQDYRNGNQPSMAAAVTTDTAFLMIKRMCEGVIESVPESLNFPAMVTKLRNYLDQHGGGVSDAFPEWTCMHSASILDSFSDVLHPDELPVMKQGHFGTYEPRTDRSRLSPAEQQREDLIILCEVLPEFAKISRLNVQVPAEDLLTNALCKMMKANSIHAMPMYGIFAAQVFLDIHHVLRQDHARPHANLQGTATRVDETLSGWFRYSRNRQGFRNWPEQNDQVFREIQALAKEWGIQDFFATNKVKGSEKIPVRPFWMLQNHPVLCGLMEFRLNLLLQEAGETLVTAWGTAIYPAHLYNACRQSAELQQTWEDMEYLIKIHSPNRIFVGAPPTEAPDYLKRFALALGASAVNFARNRRPGGRDLIVPSKKGPRGLKTTSPVRDIFRQRYVYDGPIALSTPNIVAMVSVASKAERTSAPSVDMADFARTMLVQRQYSTLQLLTAVREGVAAEELHLVFDYMGLHQRCHKMLRQLQTHLQHDLVQYFGSDYIEDESQLPFIIGYVFEVMTGAGRVAEHLRVEANGSALLYKASEVLSGFLAEGGKQESWTKARALSYAVQRAYFRGDL